MSEKNLDIKLCVVIVTYGKRFKLLEQVVKRVLEEGVCSIFIVSNAVVSDDYDLIKKMQKNNSSKIKIITKKQNMGSSGGYKSGIFLAYEESGCDFILLLDDDNLLHKGAIKALIHSWNAISREGKDREIALFANRLSQSIYKESLVNGDADLFLTRPNNFIGFHLFDLCKVLKKVFFGGFKSKNGVLKSNILKISPYGGMFFHKNLIQEIGLPNEKYFLYADDFDFSYRITQKGGKIIFVSDALIKDIDDSWNAKEINNPIIRLLKGDPLKTYYYIRNRVYFETRNLNTSPFVYNTNVFILTFLFRLFSFFENKNNYKLILRAIKDGRNGKMGVLKEK